MLNSAQGDHGAIPEERRSAEDPDRYDMLLTGFDAPIEQVMYLDSPLKEHTLLRAHRPRQPHRREAKTIAAWLSITGGQIRSLQAALAIFSPGVRGRAGFGNR